MEVARATIVVVVGVVEASDRGIGHRLLGAVLSCVALGVRATCGRVGVTDCGRAIGAGGLWAQSSL
jgi:hypothetical protein